MKLALTLLTLLLSVFAARSGLAQEKGYALTVTVTNIPGAKGNLLIGIYDSEASFTDEPLPISPKIPVTSTDDVNTTIEGLKPGTYAIAVIQDLNGNGELDRNFLGIPKEPLAFSVITEIPRTSRPACTATITSGTVDMPTTSAPMPRKNRYSARVSRFGPVTAT